jgi:hypothetical protein
MIPYRVFSPAAPATAPVAAPPAAAAAAPAAAVAPGVPGLAASPAASPATPATPAFLTVGESVPSKLSSDPLLNINDPLRSNSVPSWSLRSRPVDHSVLASSQGGALALDHGVLARSQGGALNSVSA